MADRCDKLIQQDIIFKCKDPIVKGVESHGVIVNRNDIDYDATIFDADKTNVIKTLVLKSGKKAYEIYVPGKNPFTGTTSTMNEGTYLNTFNHTVAMVVLDSGPDVCANIIDGLANGDFVVILENKYKSLRKAGSPGDSSFQIYGWHQGLQATTLENDKYSEDTRGGWNVNLTETASPMSGMFLFNTDYDTTFASIESLKQAKA
nr:MAG TPA: hypothetical protein [Caudoviricetes sp.]